MKILTDPVYETIRTIALETGMQDEADFLRQSAYWVVLGKLAKYEAESRSFEAKYNCTFEEFDKCLQRQEEAEDFEAEDDYLDWRYAHDLHQQWQMRKEILDVT